MPALSEIKFSTNEFALLNSVLPGGANWSKFIAGKGTCIESCPYFGPCTNGGCQGPNRVCSGKWQKAEQTPIVLAVMNHVVENFDHYNQGDFDVSKDRKILGKLKSRFVSALKKVATDRKYSEGHPQLKKHYTRERVSSAAAAKKLSALAGGKLVCESCKTDYFLLYGHTALWLIECHHKIPISSAEHTGTTQASDLVLLCANCHALAHSSNPPVPIGKLSKLVLAAANKSFKEGGPDGLSP